METFITSANRGSISTGPYQIDNSLKLEQDNTEYLHKTPGSSGNRRTFTLSAWIKRTEITRGSGGGDYIFQAGDGDYNQYDRTLLKFNHDDTLYWGGGSAYEIKTNRTFRDISAWYHIAMIVDTTDSTAGDRLKLYVNGVRETSFSASSNPDQNFDYAFMKDDKHVIGYNHTDSSNPASMYIAEVIWLDGTAASITDLGEFDDNGIWIPVDVSSLSVGTNGCYLDFEDSSNMGNDKSGGTDFTLNNITAIDQATDTPTNNFATINRLFKYPGSQVIKEGATKVTRTSGSGLNKTFLSTIGVNGGKWYAEFKPTANSNYVVGIIPESTHNTVAFDGNYIGNSAFPSSIGYYSDTGQKIIAPNGGSDYGGSYTTNDIISIALDMDNYRVQFHKNGVVQALSAYIDLTLDETTFMAFSYDSSGEMEVNFGGYHVNSLSSAATDENGYGSFEYAPPSGYLSLCTKNLASTGG